MSRARYTDQLIAELDRKGEAVRHETARVTAAKWRNRMYRASRHAGFTITTSVHGDEVHGLVVGYEEKENNRK